MAYHKATLPDVVRARQNDLHALEDGRPHLSTELGGRGVSRRYRWLADRNLVVAEPIRQYRSSRAGYDTRVAYTITDAGRAWLADARAWHRAYVALQAAETDYASLTTELRL